MVRLPAGVLTGVIFLWGAAVLAAPAPPAKAVVKLEGHDADVSALAFSPDGKQLASADAKGEVRFWESATGKFLFRIEAHEGPVFGLAFSPDGKTLATAGEDKVIRLWRVADGRGLRQLKGHDDAVAGLAFSPDGKLLASGSYDRTVRLWDPEKAEVVHVLKGHEDRVTAVSFSPDGKQLLSGGVLDETYRQGGGTIVTGVADWMRLWDVSEGKQVRQLPARADQLAISADGKSVWGVGLILDFQLTTVDGFDQLSRIDLETGKALCVIEGRGAGMALSGNGKRLATGVGSYTHLRGYGVCNNFVGKDGRLRLWDAETGKELARLEEKRAAVLSLTSDGDFLAAGVNNTVFLWSVDALVPDSSGAEREGRDK